MTTIATTSNARFTIGGQDIDSIIENIWFQDAREYVKKSTESFNPGVCEISGIIPNDEEFNELMEELKRLDEKTRLRYNAGMKDYLEMLAMAQVHFKWDVYSSSFWNSVRPRGFHKGLGNITPCELYSLLMDEVKWIQETRY